MAPCRHAQAPLTDHCLARYPLDAFAGLAPAGDPVIYLERSMRSATCVVTYGSPPPSSEPAPKRAVRLTRELGQAPSPRNAAVARNDRQVPLHQTTQLACLLPRERHREPPRSVCMRRHTVLGGKSLSVPMPSAPRTSLAAVSWPRQCLRSRGCVCLVGRGGWRCIGLTSSCGRVEPRLLFGARANTAGRDATRRC